MVTLLLRQEGHEVDACTCGEDALTRLRSAQHEVLLTDLVMPGMSGIELVRRAREHDGALRCAILSGHEDGGAGAAVRLRKPLDFEALIATLDAWQREGVAVR